MNMNMFRRKWKQRRIVSLAYVCVCVCTFQWGEIPSIVYYCMDVETVGVPCLGNRSPAYWFRYYCCSMFVYCRVNTKIQFDYGPLLCNIFCFIANQIQMTCIFMESINRSRGKSTSGDGVLPFSVLSPFLNTHFIIIFVLMTEKNTCSRRISFCSQQFILSVAWKWNKKKFNIKTNWEGKKIPNKRYPD